MLIKIFEKAIEIIVNAKSVIALKCKYFLTDIFTKEQQKHEWSFQNNLTRL